jgi:peptide/nickel transport system permease protein
MRRYLAGRLVASAFTLIGLSLLVFFLLLVLPGTVVEQMLGPEAGGNTDAVNRLRAEFGLDRPAPVQYLHWLANTLHGDLGTSWRTDQPVAAMIAERLPLTLEVTVLAIVFALVIGLPLGAIAGARRGTWSDQISRILMLLGSALPVYLVGTLMLLVLSLTIRWIPPTGYISPLDDPLQNISTVALPAFALGLASAAAIGRMTRGALVEVLTQDYVRTAFAKGLTKSTVVAGHALRNALIPVLTLVGLEMGQLLGGAVVTESIFSLPGVGRMLIDAVGQRDYPVVLGTVLVVAALFILINLLTDLLYAQVDPRVRYG